MSEKTPQDYARELIDMYRSNRQEILEEVMPTVSSDIESDITDTADKSTFQDGNGGLQINVTAFDRLYPVPNALVTVFTGTPENMTVVKTGTTDQSGKSEIFDLSTPLKSDSQQVEESTVPYFNYNILVQSDGYVEQIVKNIPVFSGVVSVQGIDLLPVSAAGGHTSPQIIDEETKYNL